ncbi:MAG: HD domain-containing protein [Anaerofustis stercorihominis]|nr:HD domain-containing protein [Anaerofustis stercorihominis]
MIYTEMTKIALKICFDAHKDQTDKTGLPYIFHPFHLAEQMDTEKEVCAALLHDVVEDTPLTFDDLENMGISRDVTDTLRLLTHSDDDDYFEYVTKIKADPCAVKVKLADLRHNSDLSRFAEPTEKDIARAEKYKKAIVILSE